MALIYGVDYAFMAWDQNENDLVRCRALERKEFDAVRVNPKQRRQCTNQAMFIKYTPVGAKYYCVEHLLVPVLRWR